MQIMQENSRGHPNTGEFNTIAGLLNAFLRDFAYAPLRIAKQRESFENSGTSCPKNSAWSPDHQKN